MVWKRKALPKVLTMTLGWTMVTYHQYLNTSYDTNLVGWCGGLTPIVHM
jgi:hypothetical protein